VTNVTKLFLGRSRTLDRVFYKSQKDTSCEINIEGLQESFPLLTCSKSTDVLGDSMQYTTDSKLSYLFVACTMYYNYVYYSLYIVFKSFIKLHFLQKHVKEMIELN
jgi:hypothetical protein